MHILITGAGGFLGQRLARTLLADDQLGVTKLTLTDLNLPPIIDPRVDTLELDVSDPQAVRDGVPQNVDATYYLAAVVSAGAEADFDLGMRVNVVGIQNVLEALRRGSPGSRFIFTSSLAIYGGELPEVITERTVFTPKSSYGTQKAIGELLANDYSRKGFIDGVTLRLPTVSIRPGAPNKAASSFASDIIREPLHGREAVCPVDPSLTLWLTSPSAAVRSLRHALDMPTKDLDYRSVNAPGITITVREMIQTLGRIAGREASERIRYDRDKSVEQIVASWPAQFDTAKAEALGFTESDSFEETLQTFIREEL